MSGTRLRKRLGQHHLRSGALCRPVLDFLHPGGRTVLEIGPGGGVLTRELLRAGARVLSCELDPEWAFRLARDPALRPVSLVLGDALDLAWERLPRGTLVAGNLPYGISTVLIGRLLARSEGVARAAFLVQLEVALRLAAGPGDPDYGALSVLTQARAAVTVLGRVARGSFRPVPKVGGAFVGLVRRPPPLPASRMPEFAATVRLAFARRRKTLRNALAAGWGRERTEEVLGALGIERRVRSEQLTLEDFVAIHRRHQLLG
ncbi:MAG: 16S rRNA (adenine(1518)-N(6)/adenine(1519)-N(6))-dimethyltransferase RsmA [Thermoanaerobaculia bacterium]